LIATSAHAHPTLKSASPPVDGTAAAPTEIRVSFSEAVTSKFSSVELQDQSGMKIATGKVATDARDEKQLVVSLLAPLKAGTLPGQMGGRDRRYPSGERTYSFKVAL